MTNWPGDWISSSERMDNQTSFNDNGTFYLIDSDKDEAWAFVESLPPHLENRC